MEEKARLVPPAGGEYTWPFQVRHYELDRLGRVRPEVYLNWLQEAGMLASASAGFPMARYEAIGGFWWVRRFFIEWRAHVAYRDALAATTWISEFRRLRCNREYEIRRQDDGRLIFSAQADWVFVDVASGQPTRIPADILEAFPALRRAAVDSSGEFVADLAGASSVECEPFVAPHTVAQHELDTMGHVNNATYLVWLFDNLAEAARVDVVPERLDIEYLHPASVGDRLRIVCQPVSRDAARGVWRHEVLTDGVTVLARARSRCRFDERG